jgi:hypothetical protein
VDVVSVANVSAKNVKIVIARSVALRKILRIKRKNNPKINNIDIKSASGSSLILYLRMWPKNHMIIKE